MFLLSAVWWYLEDREHYLRLSLVVPGLLRIKKVRGEYLCWLNYSAGEETVQVAPTMPPAPASGRRRQKGGRIQTRERSRCDTLGSSDSEEQQQHRDSTSSAEAFVLSCRKSNPLCRPLQVNNSPTWHQVEADVGVRAEAAVASGRFSDSHHESSAASPHQ
ncbi:Hypothetical predicted protein [Cloeon dipterum]|uniref:Uncharacterized protein n=1 Tax=Cloeon dipterum TaxID=197152 RepID=A0A8S1CZ84_9INSE|nr:Hypothetical predicted protein [Cloeon dipterum]